MKLKLKSELPMDAHQIAVIRQGDKTYVYGLELGQLESAEVTRRLTSELKWDEVGKKWTLHECVSQSFPIGKGVACWLAWWHNHPGASFFSQEDWCTGDQFFHVPNHRLGIYSFTVEEGLSFVCTFEHPARMEKVMEVILEHGTPINDTLLHALIERDQDDPDPLHRGDDTRSYPEDLEVEADERPQFVASKNDLDAQMVEAIRMTSMVDKPTRDVTVGDVFSDRLKQMQAHTRKIKDVYGEHASEVLTLRTLAGRYRDMIQVDSGRAEIFEIDQFGDKTSRGHLIWMLDEIVNNFEQSVTKKHRWFGYIQGLLIAYGYTTVDRERDYTRDMFRGQ